MWSEKYEALSNYDKGEFRRLVNYLLSHTYLVRDIFRPDKAFVDINPDYRTASRLLELLREYLSVAGWKLMRDDDYGVISLTNEFENNRYRDMDRFTTLFLYTCRLIYEEGRTEGDSSRIVKTDTSAVLEKMRTLGLLEKAKTSQTSRINAQRTLARFNIIQKIEPNAWDPDGNNLLIYSSILSIIPNSAINSLYEQLEELKLIHNVTAAGPDTEEEP